MRGGTYYGDIAIDDVELLNGPCPPPASCDFESGLCSFGNVISGDDFDWLRSQGTTNTGGTGPLSDHTQGDSRGKPLPNNRHSVIHSVVLSERGDSASLGPHARRLTW